MIKSMTGFAAAETIAGDIAVTADIRSYNSRHLDVVLRLPASCTALEDRIKSLVAERIVRGRVELKVQIKDRSEAAAGYEIDRPRAQAIHAVLGQLKREFDLSGDISLELMVAVGGIIQPVENVNDIESLWSLITECLRRCLDDLETMRKNEGDFIAADLTARLNDIEACIGQIKNDSDDLPNQYQERLKERIAALIRETVEIDPGRIAQEAAFLADRSDISEEIVRAASHIRQFRQIMRSKEPAGRKLNFLLQELHREFNTIGSKVGHADTSHRVVEVKSELEKIREQIQNVE